MLFRSDVHSKSVFPTSSVIKDLVDTFQSVQFAFADVSDLALTLPGNAATKLAVRCRCKVVVARNIIILPMGAAATKHFLGCRSLQ